MTEIPVADLGAGVAMPMVGLGTWQLTGRRGYEAIGYALEVGYRHIDTAHPGGNGQAEPALTGANYPAPPCGWQRVVHR